MNNRFTFLTLIIFLNFSSAFSDTILFQDDFHNALASGWTWIRENPKGHKTAEDGLEILIEPGNMWGGDNDAKNILLRTLSKFEDKGIAIEATVENNPTNQYEQIDLVWYYNDSNMVKIGLELVDKQLSLVMGREENDKTRTLAIIPLESTKIQVKLIVKGHNIKGQFRILESDDWQNAGDCDLPSKGGEAKASIQAYQGSSDKEHWAKVSKFKVTQIED